MGDSREQRLNQAVVSLYAQRGEQAEALLLALRKSDPRWLPAARWWARARAELARPDALEAARALMSMSGLQAKDALFVGNLYAQRGEHGPARDCLARALELDPYLYLGWLSLGDEERALAHPAAARKAWQRSRELHESPGVLQRLGLALVGEPRARLVPPLRPGELLRYRARYLFLTLGSVELRNEGPRSYKGRTVQLLRFEARSNPALFFFHMSSRFESWIAADGTVLRHRNVSDDSATVQHAVVYEMDPDQDACLVRDVRGGLFSYERLPLPALAQDGVSVTQLTRAVARRGEALTVPTAVDGAWKATRLRTLGPEKIRWGGRQLEAQRVESVGLYEGPAGLSGTTIGWFSQDERALPYRLRMKIGLGSIVLELLPESEADRQP